MLQLADSSWAWSRPIGVLVSGLQSSVHAQVSGSMIARC
jgi:hypothetical protein